jgi:hypothetical protein
MNDIEWSGNLHQNTAAPVPEPGLPYARLRNAHAGALAIHGRSGSFSSA